MTAPDDRAAESAFRGSLYLLLGRLMAAPPDGEILERVAGLASDGSALGEALRGLGEAARQTTCEAAGREYQALFVGIGRGELVPYASYYRTGFLNERPLARVRDDMAALGIQRADGTREPEDHVGTLCEIMSGLAVGAFGPAATEAAQKAFFSAHLEPWAGRFFADLETASQARFYAAVGRLGRVFLALDGGYLDAIETAPAGPPEPC